MSGSGFTTTIYNIYSDAFSMHIDDFFVDNVERNNLKHVVPGVALLFYVFVIFSLPSVVIKIYPSKASKKSKASRTLRMICFYWNLSLSLFSIISLIAVTIPLGRIWYYYGLIELLCDENGKYIINQRRPIHFFYSAFLLSKFVELGDTFFLILKKPTRRPSFLHCYHHITVMASCWYLAVTNVSVAHYGIPVNLFIHSIMYMYYALYEIGYKQSWGMVLTILQMIQMILGVIAWIIWAYMKYEMGINCGGKRRLKTVMSVGCVLYATYFYLFFRFFMNRYFSKKKENKKKKKT